MKSVGGNHQSKQLRTSSGAAGSMMMYYVYILRSDSHPEKYYTGYTTDVHRRLTEHNQGKGIHTKPYRPWTLKSYVAFPDKHRALAFEKYLKTGSGRALAIKHL